MSSVAPAPAGGPVPPIHRASSVASAGTDGTDTKATTRTNTQFTNDSSNGTYVPVITLKKKTITLVGSVALLINNVTGGSMVVLPQTFQQAGWVLPILALFGVAMLSVTCGIMMIECMTLVPGNNRFQKRLEYTNLAHIYFPTWLYWIAQIFYQLSILAQNISMIVQSVQVMDFTLVALTGYSCAIPQFSPEVQFTCSYPGGYTTNGVSPFGDWYLISLGWLVTCIMVMPLGFIDLDDNDAVQKGGWLAVMSIIVVWCALAITQPAGLVNVEAFGGQYDTLMGTVLFNFAIVYTIPSWANEKRPSVSIVKALMISMLGAVTLFASLGYFGGAGFPPPTNNQTLLNQIYGLGTKISSITFYLFPACVNLTTIPVNSIMQRYNLKEAGVCGAKWAAFWGVVAPWLIAIPLYTGSGYQTLVTWAGLILNSSVNFVFPPILYIIAIRRYGTGPNAIRTLLEEAQLTGNSLGGPLSKKEAQSGFSRGETLIGGGRERDRDGERIGRDRDGAAGGSGAGIEGSGEAAAEKSKKDLTRHTFGTESTRKRGMTESRIDLGAVGLTQAGGDTPVLTRQPTTTGTTANGGTNSGQPSVIARIRFGSNSGINATAASSDATSGGGAKKPSILRMPTGDFNAVTSSSAAAANSPPPTSHGAQGEGAAASTPPVQKSVAFSTTPEISSIEEPGSGAADAAGAHHHETNGATDVHANTTAVATTTITTVPIVGEENEEDQTEDDDVHEEDDGGEDMLEEDDHHGDGEEDIEEEPDTPFDGEEGIETEDERLEREYQLRQVQKEEMRRQRTLKKLRRARQKAAAAAANPHEIAKAHEEILALDLSPPNPKQKPWHFSLWLLALPWHCVFRLTVPHSATSARFSKYWYITLFMITGWCVLISFFVVWSSSMWSNVTGFHPFAFSLFIVGFCMRGPNLLTEYNSFKRGSGDLNRIFSNSVWQLLICLPIPWLLYSATHAGNPFVVYSGTQSILMLTMFLLSALILIMFKNYEWYMLRPVGLASLSIITLIVLMVFLLDYNVLMDLSSQPCLPGDLGT